ncbi:MAG: DUF1830 domain-containing protein [Cyanosarcina radialis HA8281-LM2]|jgi:hypothetical protein|nr:DUF1830 domain-containing protein [Cyanosarcina radialis HA8281-LM2]
MAQILDPIPDDNSSAILCCYVNATSQIQVARITNVPNWYFERVVFPGQRLLFETLPDAYLEIHTGMMASAILSDKIPCERLSIKDNDNNDNSASDRQSLEGDRNIDAPAQSTKPTSQKRLENQDLLATATVG